MTTRTEIRQRAAELVEAGWTQLFLARTSEGLPCDTGSPEAVSFCLIGSLLRAEEELSGCSDCGETWFIVDEISNKLRVDSIVDWNNHPTRTMPEVAAVLRGEVTRYDSVSNNI